MEAVSKGNMCRSSVPPGAVRPAADGVDFRSRAYGGCLRNWWQIESGLKDVVSNVRTDGGGVSADVTIGDRSGGHGGLKAVASVICRAEPSDRSLGARSGIIGFASGPPGKSLASLVYRRRDIQRPRARMRT